MCVCHLGSPPCTGRDDISQYIVRETEDPTERERERDMKVFPVPCLQDNYAFLLVDDISKDAGVVDPVEPERLIQEARTQGATIKFVLTTHRHWDHAGGNEKIKKLIPGIKVYGSSEDNVEGQTDVLADGDQVSLGGSITIKAIYTPCHTRGHICYHVIDISENVSAVFTGDTLFIGGCGRFFEGTPEQMHYSLCQKLALLPPSTQVYCGHEYTVKNLSFALVVEPDNVALQRKLGWAKDQQALSKPTVPSTIGEELETNPFMRVNVKTIQDATGFTNPTEVMGALRRWKDGWQG